jgi:hypothetical protein
MSRARGESLSNRFHAISWRSWSTAVLNENICSITSVASANRSHTWCSGNDATIHLPFDGLSHVGGGKQVENHLTHVTQAPGISRLPMIDVWRAACPSDQGIPDPETVARAHLLAYSLCFHRQAFANGV